MLLGKGGETDVAKNEYCGPLEMWFYQAGNSDLGHEAGILGVVLYAEVQRTGAWQPELKAHHTAAR